ncbi:hypothetical protein M5K25_017233 [Dendrobium thyrsiflorum]|uniref:Uncharacterized protein n=1 Tax=Dendrobium thyrsiflorum TaxID=117978 RepID=A0ABD0UM32_DENTH
MDPDSFRSTLSNLAFGNVMAAAARDYQKRRSGMNYSVALPELQGCDVVLSVSKSSTYSALALNLQRRGPCYDGFSLSILLVL